MGPELDSSKECLAKFKSRSLVLQFSSGVSWLHMALIAWELLGRCLASALGHACIVHLSLNIAIFKRLTRRGIQQPELSEGWP